MSEAKIAKCEPVKIKVEAGKHMPGVPVDLVKNKRSVMASIRI